MHCVLQSCQNLAAVHLQHHQRIAERLQLRQIEHGDVAGGQRRPDAAALQQRNRRVRPMFALVRSGALPDHAVRYEIAEIALVETARAVHEDARHADHTGLHVQHAGPVALEHGEHARIALDVIVEQNRLTVEFDQLAGGVELKDSI